MWLGPWASQKKKKNSMPDFCTATATRRGAGSHDRWGSMAGGLTPTTTARPMRPDGVRCEPMATAQTPATTPPIHPHWRPSVVDRRGSAGDRWWISEDRRAIGRAKPPPPTPARRAIYRVASEAIQHPPPTPPINPHRPIKTHRIFSDRRPHRPPRGRGSWDDRRGVRTGVSESLSRSVRLAHKLRNNRHQTRHICLYNN